MACCFEAGVDEDACVVATVNILENVLEVVVVKDVCDVRLRRWGVDVCRVWGQQEHVCWKDFFVVRLGGCWRWRRGDRLWLVFGCWRLWMRLELVVEENVVCAVFPRERDDGAVWHTEVWLLVEVGRDALLVELMH